MCLPGRLDLEPCFPNPFRTATRISFFLPMYATWGPPAPVSGHRSSAISLIVYDQTGRKVRTLLLGSHASLLVPRSFIVTWDGSDDKGRSVGEGVYFFRLESGANALTRKVVKLD